MFRQLLGFEWRYHTHKLLFVFLAFIFLLFGVIFTVAGYMPIVHINSPWSVAYTLGILSMGGLFPVVIFASNAILRPRSFDAGDGLCYTCIQMVFFID